MHHKMNCEVEVINTCTVFEDACSKHQQGPNILITVIVLDPGESQTL